VTFNIIKQRLSDVLYKITSQKFEDPGEGSEFAFNVALRRMQKTDLVLHVCAVLYTGHQMSDVTFVTQWSCLLVSCCPLRRSR
jgi:hypothetical protein